MKIGLYIDIDPDSTYTGHDGALLPYQSLNSAKRRLFDSPYTEEDIERMYFAVTNLYYTDGPDLHFAPGAGIQLSTGFTDLMTVEAIIGSPEFDYDKWVDEMNARRAEQTKGKGK